MEIRQELGLLKSQLFYYTCHSGVVLERPQDVADIDAYTFVVLWREPHVAGERFLVAVEGKADELSACVQDRTTGVASCYVVVCQEIDIHILTLRAGAPLAPVALAVQQVLPVIQAEVILLGIVLFKNAVYCGLPVADDSVAGLQRADYAICHPHGGIGIRILGLSLVLTHLIERMGKFLVEPADVRIAFRFRTHLAECRRLGI